METLWFHLPAHTQIAACCSSSRSLQMMPSPTQPINARASRDWIRLLISGAASRWCGEKNTQARSGDPLRAARTRAQASSTARAVRGAVDTAEANGIILSCAEPLDLYGIN